MSAPPATQTAEFTAKLDAALTAAKHGAVIVSPCISQCEREIARRAFAKDMAGAGDCEIDYKGAKLADVDAEVKKVV